MDPLTLFNQIANVRVGLTANASNTASSLVLAGNLKVNTLSCAGAQIAGGGTTAALSFTGSTSGTLLQLINTVATVSGSATTTAFAALGVTPGTALEAYALTAHRWWTGSTGTTSGSLGMQLSGGTTQASSTTGALVISGGGVLIANTTNASSVSGNALHVTGGGLIARDLYVGGLLNSRAIAPSSATFYHTSTVSLSAALSPFGYTYSSSAVWTTSKAAGTDAAAFMQTSGQLVAPTKALVTLCWNGYVSPQTSIFFLPLVSAYVLTAAQLNNVTYVPSTIVTAGEFSVSYTLPMAAGDTIALATRNSVSVSNSYLSILARPLGAF